MTPPRATGPSASAGAPSPPAVSLSLHRLRKRADFLRAARARRVAGPGFVLQARRRDSEETDPQAIRVGFTCSRKVGNAVARNRAKRRLREIARLVLPAHGRPGWDYVLIGRRDETAGRDFERLQDELRETLARVHAAPDIKSNR